MIAPDATIATIAPRLARGQISARALLNACLSRIAACDGALHAMLALNPASRPDADAADRAVAQGRTLGPLHGIPIVIKDNIDLAGMPTTSGSIGLRNALPLRDADMVARLRAVGAIIVGKTNLSELSFEIRSRSSLGGDVIHPLDPGVTPGGSSGGAAVAVHAGFALAALGTDTGGSLRIPAAYTGLVGFRPALGALSMRGIAPLAPSTDTVGPIARSVEDVEILLAAMGLYFGAAPARPFRVGVLRQAFGSDPHIAAAVQHAVARLERQGIGMVDPVALPEDVLPIGGEHIVDAEFADAFDVYLATNFRPGSAPADIAELVQRGAHLPEYAQTLRARLARKGGSTAAILAAHARLTTAMAGLMASERLDGLLFPTSRVVPTSFDNPKGGWAPELAARSGWPALSVPSGSLVARLPVGVELIGPPGTEAILLALAGLIENTAA